MARHSDLPVRMVDRCWGLAKALAEAMALSDAARREMGEHGRKLVEEKYTWDAVARKMINGYEEVLNARA